MKKIVFKLGMACILILVVVPFSSMRLLHASASTQIKIDKKNFPGKNFRQNIKQFDKNKNGYLSKKEIKAVKQLKICDDSCDHSDCDCDYSDALMLNMKGMEYFTNIREIRIEFIHLKNFDISKMKKLKTLSISRSYLRTLDLRKNKVLSRLDVSKNNITKIKFSSSSKLRILNFDSEKKLKKPDFASLKKLEVLSGQDMPYKTLDLRKCKNLKSFTWYGDRLKRGTLQKISFGKENRKLKSLVLDTNKVTSVDWLSKLPSTANIKLLIV